MLLMVSMRIEYAIDPANMDATKQPETGMCGVIDHINKIECLIDFIDGEKPNLHT